MAVFRITLRSHNLRTKGDERVAVGQLWDTHTLSQWPVRDEHGLVTFNSPHTTVVDCMCVVYWINSLIMWA